MSSKTSSRLRRGDLAPSLEVLDAQGQPYELSQAWQAGPVLLTFLRHFG